MHYLPAMIVALLGIFSAHLAPAQLPDEDAAPGPADIAEHFIRNRLNFTPNPRYTVFDGPLREDGTIDYVKALNTAFSEGVTHENNAYRGLFLVLPIDDLAPAYLGQVRGLLGIEPGEREGLPQFVQWDAFAEDHELDADEADSVFFDFIDGPFDRGQGALLQRWIVLNRPALDAAAEALDRPRYWYPLAHEDEENAALFYVLLPQLGNHRALARAMERDIRLALSEGDTDRAIKLIRALRRLGAHQTSEPTLISNLVGISIDALTVELVSDLLSTHQLDGTALATLQQCWDDRPEPSSISQAVLIGERCSTLDILMQLAAGRMSPDGLLVELGLAEVGQGFDPDEFDMNRAAARVSREYRNMARICDIEFYVDYARVAQMHERAAMDRWQSEIAAAFVGVEDAHIRKPLLSKEAFTDGLSAMILRILTPALTSCAKTQFRLRVREDVARTAIACERYRLAEGGYPPNLDALVPRHLDAVPIDFMDGETLRYRVDDDGAAVIYSIGTDLEDDGALDDEEDWQDGDYRVRLALPEE